MGRPTRKASEDQDPITQAERDLVVSRFRELGGLSPVARVTGVKVARVKRIIDEHRLLFPNDLASGIAVREDPLDAARLEAREELAQHHILLSKYVVATQLELLEQITKAQSALLVAMLDPDRLERASVGDLRAAFAMLTDKRLLLTGQPTQRGELVVVNPENVWTEEELVRAAQLRAKLEAKMHGDEGTIEAVGYDVSTAAD